MVPHFNKKNNSDPIFPIFCDPKFSKKAKKRPLCFLIETGKPQENNSDPIFSLTFYLKYANFNLEINVQFAKQCPNLMSNFKNEQKL